MVNLTSNHQFVGIAIAAPLESWLCTKCSQKYSHPIHQVAETATITGWKLQITPDLLRQAAIKAQEIAVAKTGDGEEENLEAAIQACAELGISKEWAPVINFINRESWFEIHDEGW